MKLACCHCGGGHRSNYCPTIKRAARRCRYCKSPDHDGGKCPMNPRLSGQDGGQEQQQLTHGTAHATVLVGPEERRDG